MNHQLDRGGEATSLSLSGPEQLQHECQYDGREAEFADFRLPAAPLSR